MSHEPFDPVKGAFIVLILLVAGVLSSSAFIFVGCFYSIAALCDRGAGIKDVTLEIITVLAIILGARKSPGDRP
jgi:hypothetical protein